MTIEIRIVVTSEGALTGKGHENLQDSGNVPYLDLLVIQEQTCKYSPHHVLHKFYCMNVISQLQKKRKTIPVKCLWLW